MEARYTIINNLIPRMYYILEHFLKVVLNLRTENRDEAEKKMQSKGVRANRRRKSTGDRRNVKRNKQEGQLKPSQLQQRHQALSKNHVTGIFGSAPCPQNFFGGFQPGFLLPIFN